MREACSALVGADGYLGNYAYATIDTTPDAVLGPGRLVLTRTGQRLRLVTLPGPPGSRSHTLRVDSYTRSGAHTYSPGLGL